MCHPKWFAGFAITRTGSRWTGGRWAWCSSSCWRGGHLRDTHAAPKFEVFNNILGKKPKYKHASKGARSVLRRLLEKDPDQRGGWDDIQGHKWFGDVDWDLLAKRRLRPPWVPQLGDKGGPDLRYFIEWKEQPDTADDSVGDGGDTGHIEFDAE
ncbi:unnamed protein product, partial [Heterosigma akashiwo]